MMEQPAAPRDQFEFLPPRVSEWFESHGWLPFDYQVECWKAYQSGENGLVNAPTGTGKTLAVWLGPIIEWLSSAQCLDSNTIRNPARRRPEDFESSTVLWITPLRALAADTLHALTLPIKEMELPWSVEMRTGDTSAWAKRRQMKRFPTALITTPESLSLLLSYPDTREKLATLKCVVVDEWHELLGNKRGVQTELALARLRKWRPELRTWGLSATISNPEAAAATLAGVHGSARLIFERRAKDLKIRTLVPQSIDRFPWAGHLGRLGVPGVASAIGEATSSLIFTNTRNQAEQWYQWLTLYEPDWEDSIALHHGSIDRAERERVERGLADGELRAVVCTSSLDLGVDFPAVELVIQVGSPKGIGRLLQRAGRSGHHPGGVSKIICVPTNAFELIEFSAARTAIERGRIEPRRGLTGSIDVLLQHLVTIALGGGFRNDELLNEIRSTTAFADITEDDWQWALSFVTNGGSALKAYPEYRKVSVENGVYTVDNELIARMHRLSIGTITSDSMMLVQYVKGAKLGQIEEQFVARLNLGDRFTFAGRVLEFVRLKDMKVFVRRSSGGSGTVPKWLGGRLPLSSQLASAVREKLGDASNGEFDDPEMLSVKAVLAVQQLWSRIPGTDELLIEHTKSREGYHLFIYPFAGRSVHEGLAALLAYRLTKDHPRSVNASVNDYGIELLSYEPIVVDSWSSLFGTDHLTDDLLTCLNAVELARRQFRDIARISGLVFSGYPGSQKAARQIQASSGLLYDVFKENDPDNLLLEQARREVLVGQLELSRLKTTLNRLSEERIVEVKTKRLTPLAFPIWAERIQASVSTEKFGDRIKKMVLQLEKAARW